MASLLGPIGRRNGRQMTGRAGEATPRGMQRLPAGARRDAEDVRDGLRAAVSGHPAGPDAVLVDETGFRKGGTTSVGVRR